MPGPITSLDFLKLTFVIPGEDGDDGYNMRPVNDAARLVYQSATKAHREPRTHLEMIQAIAPTRNGYEIARKAALEVAALPRIAFKAVDVNDERRELCAIISLANYTDSQGDVVTREALANACAGVLKRGVGSVGIDRNHRTDLHDVRLERPPFMGSPSLPPPYTNPDACYGAFSFTNPSATWDAAKANRIVGMSWFGSYSR